MDGRSRRSYNAGISKRNTFDIPTRCYITWRHPDNYTREKNLPKTTTGHIKTVEVRAVKCKKNYVGRPSDEPTGDKKVHVSMPRTFYRRVYSPFGMMKRTRGPEASK